MMPYPTDVERQAFWTSAQFTVTECIEWFGRRHRGYGYLTFRGKSWRAHRFAYLLAYGEIPEGKVVCHKCNNAACVNAAHLYAGTHYENMQDRKRAGHYVADAEWFRKHPPGWNARADRRVFGERNAKSKLTTPIVQEARLRYFAGETYAQLAKDYGVTPTAMRRAVLGITWSRLA